MIIGHDSITSVGIYLFTSLHCKQGKYPETIGKKQATTKMNNSTYTDYYLLLSFIIINLQL